MSCRVACVLAIVVVASACAGRTNTCNADTDCDADEQCINGGCAFVIIVEGEDEAGEGEGEGEGEEGEGEGEGEEGEGEEGEGEGEEGEGEEGEGEGEPPAASTFERWGLNEPNDYETGEDCLALLLQPTVVNRAADWDDRNCTDTYAFVCEGVTVNDEQTCIELGGLERGLACNLRVTYDEARAHCALLGGTLARIDSATENDQLVDVMLQIVGAEPALWLGGADRELEGTWVWPDGAQLPVDPFSNWGIGRPDGGVDENCLRMAIADDAAIALLAGEWDDKECNELADGFVCDTDVSLAAFCSQVQLESRWLCAGTVTAADASATCALASGTLAKIESKDEVEAIVAIGEAGATTGTLWIGANDVVTEGAWLWGDGVLLDAF